jgi:hypothetical protein
MTFGGDFSSQYPIVLARRDRIKSELDYVSTSLSYVTPHNPLYTMSVNKENLMEKRIVDCIIHPNDTQPGAVLIV